MSNTDLYSWPRWLVESTEFEDWEKWTWSVLKYRQEHNAYVSAALLAQWTKITPGAIYVRLNKMSAKGLVEKSGLVPGIGRPTNWRAVVPDKYKREEGD